MSLKDRIAARTDTKVAAFKALTYRLHPEPDNEHIYGTFDPENNNDDAALVDSIRSVGLIQPITVRPHPALAEEYIIVSGHRRLAAHVHLKLSHIPVTVIQPETEEELLDLKAGLVQTNTMTRTRTPAIMAREIEYLKPVMKRLKELNPEKYAGISVREMIADHMDVSETTVKNIQKIQNNSDPETYQNYKEGKITQKQATLAAERSAAKKIAEDMIVLADLSDTEKQRVEDALTDVIITKESLATATEPIIKEKIADAMKSHVGGNRQGLEYSCDPKQGIKVKVEGITKPVRLRQGEAVQAVMSGILRKRQIAMPAIEPVAEIPAEQKESNEFIYNHILKKIEKAMDVLNEHPELALKDSFQKAVFSLELQARLHVKQKEANV